MSARRLTILLTAPALAAALSGCISVLPKTKPDQLYSFGQRLDARPPPAAPAASRVGVLLAGVDFPRAAATDRILTVSGVENAYIAEARWAGPASILFREAVERGFDRAAQRSRLLARGEAGRTALVLRLDVLDFEAAYPNGMEGTPVVLVTVRARLSGPDGRILAEKPFDVRRPAGDNRVGPIAQAFDSAVSEVVNGLAAWTDETAAALPPEVAVGVPPSVTSTTRSTTVTTTQVTPPGAAPQSATPQAPAP